MISNFGTIPNTGIGDLWRQFINREGKKPPPAKREVSPAPIRRGRAAIEIEGAPTGGDEDDGRIAPLPGVGNDTIPDEHTPTPPAVPKRKKLKIDPAKIKKIVYVEYPRPITQKKNAAGVPIPQPKGADATESDGNESGHEDSATGVIGQKKFKTHVVFTYDFGSGEEEVTRSISFGVHGVEDYIDKGNAAIGQMNVSKLGKHAKHILRGNFWRVRLLNSCPKMRQAYFNLLEELNL